MAVCLLRKVQRAAYELPDLKWTLPAPFAAWRATSSISADGSTASTDLTTASTDLTNGANNIASCPGPQPRSITASFATRRRSLTIREMSPAHRTGGLQDSAWPPL